MALPYLLKSTAKDQSIAARTVNEEDKWRITCWPESIQYLLRMYATSGAIREAILALRNTAQLEEEN